MNKASAALLCAALLLAVGPVASAIEEPAYEVVARNDTFEVRRYEPYIVAETTVQGDLGSAGGKAFRILAGYIFGKNEDQTRMNMTAPVETRPAPGSASLVTSEKSGDDVYTFAFVMESSYSLDTLPEPVDSRVRFREVPARLVAAHRFSGRWSEGNVEKHEQALLGALGKLGYETIGAPTLARYDGPMTPWFLRRNEVLVDVAKR